MEITYTVRPHSVGWYIWQEGDGLARKFEGPFWVERLAYDRCEELKHQQQRGA